MADGRIVWRIHRTGKRSGPQSDESTTAWDESTTSRIVPGRIGRGAGRIGHWLPTRTAWFFQQFREDGFIKLPGVFSPTTLAVFEREISRLTFAENPLAGVPMHERSTYGKAFIQVFNL